MSLQKGPELEPTSSSPLAISRESVLSDVRIQEQEDESTFQSSQFSEETDLPSQLDPDIPIPSRETDEHFEASDIKEEDDEQVDLYSIPQYIDPQAEALRNRHVDVKVEESSVQDGDSCFTKEGESPYEDADEIVDRSTPINNPSYLDAKQPSHSPGGFQIDNSFDVSFHSYPDHSSSPSIKRNAEEPAHIDDCSVQTSPHLPVSPEKDEEAPEIERPESPASVIRHDVEDDLTPVRESSQEDMGRESPEVPEPSATVKTPGSNLKVRPSLTSADVQAMAATRRTASGQSDPGALESKTSAEPTPEPSSPTPEPTYGQVGTDQPQLVSVPAEKQRKSSLVKLDIPVETGDEGLGFALDQEFDRVIQTQKVAFNLSLSQIGGIHNSPKPPIGTSDDGAYLDTNAHAEHIANKSILTQRGYLMRQNTNMIVASSTPQDEPASLSKEARVEDSAGASRPSEVPTRKLSQQTWTTMPWNGNTRRQSVKMTGAGARKKTTSETAPPLPGQESSVQPHTTESEAADDEAGEGDNERGRVFVKVVGVRNLDLPLPRGEYTCVTGRVQLIF